MKKKTNLLLLVVLAIVGSGGWWFWAIAAPSSDFTQDLLSQGSNLSSDFNENIKLEINEGEATQAIASRLETAGVIRSSFALRIWLKYIEIKGDRNPLRAGVYQFSNNQSLAQVVEKMQNQVPEEVVFTIPEGWSITQMASYFEKEGFFPATDFIKATKTNLDRRTWLPTQISSLEGFLFPDTYQIPLEQATPGAIIDLMLGQFETVALPLWQSSLKSSNPNFKLNLQEWVTFASIVEKEAVLDQERDIIAGVFSARLKQGMRLESDPTVEYGLNIKQTKEQPLTLRQVRTPSPYNTYLISGLPIGAIASPGLKSLQASLNPPKTDYLFFVARYDGSHIFSRTFAEHQAAIEIITQNLKSKSPS